MKKPSYTKFNNSFKNSVDDIMERLGGESSSESDKNDESDNEEKEPSAVKKAPPKPRTILKAKSKTPAPKSKEEAKASQPSQKK